MTLNIAALHRRPVQASVMFLALRLKLNATQLVKSAVKRRNG
jgi:hypothetical protein